MSIAHLLTEFSDDATEVDPARMISELELEEERLTAFERGYSAGWEDALKAQGEERMKAATALRQSLDDLTFTYHEARGQMLASLRDVLCGMVSAVLPRVLRAALAPRMADEMAELIVQDRDMPLEVLVSPDIDKDLSDIVASVQSAPFVAVPSEDLKPGQIVLRVGSSERELDLDRLLERIAQSVDGYFEQLEEELGRG